MSHGCRFDPLLLADHFTRHGAAMGATSAEECERLASAFLAAPLDEHILIGQNRSGDVLRLDTRTGEFAVLSPHDLIRTRKGALTHRAFLLRPGETGLSVSELRNSVIHLLREQANDAADALLSIARYPT